MRILLTLLITLLAAPLHAQPQPAPDFALKSVGGENLRLSEFRGDVVVIAFWASWCSECRELLEILERLGVNLAGTDARIIGISVDHSDKRAERAATGVVTSYPILLDVKQDVVKRFEIEKIPAVVIVDRGGAIAATFKGSAVVGTDYDAAVRAILEE